MNKFFKVSFLFAYVIILSSTCKNETNANVGEKQSNLTNSIIQSANNWPGFRGEHASGVSDGQNLPDGWDGPSGKNIQWKVRIPGLAHSSPIIWEDRLFVTTAISSRDSVSFRHGLYGDGDASDDRSVHRFCILCLNKKTGKMLWEQTAVKGVPIDKRHIKSTYASSTPFTNGQLVIALFGSQGLYAYDLDGNFIWKKDLGRMDCGAYDRPEYEWGTASSPIIYEDRVIVQVDTQNESFIIACDIETGETIWKTMRDELPSWGTPTIVASEHRTDLVTNSSNHIYGYDPATGKELWRLGGSSKITAPTPIFSDNLIIVCSGRRPEAPIFAIRMGAVGDITLSANTTSNAYVAWSKLRRGPYMPTPIIYGGRLYVLQNNGRFESYELDSGDLVYRESLGHGGGGFSGSPVAADGRIFLPSEDGDIFVIESGPDFVVVNKNSMGERLMSTPAISEGMLYVRAEHHLFAVGF